MQNLFVNTKFNLAEEDRLTNAFMQVIAHADWLVKRDLLTRMGIPASGLTMDDELNIALQPVFENSRPDAELIVGAYRIVVETKLDERLDDEQFVRHWRHLQTAQSPTVLLSLTKSFSTPSIVLKLNRENSNPDLVAHHLSWSSILDSIRTAKGASTDNSVTAFLLGHFEDYLLTLGYYSLEGSIVKTLKTYGELLRNLHEIKERTETQLLGHLNLLKDSVMAQDCVPPLVWHKKNFGVNSVNQSHVNFTFLTADAPAHRGGRYRMVPSIDAQSELRLAVYFAYNHKEGKDDSLLNWLLKCKDDHAAELGPLHHFGCLATKPYLFHISRRYDAASAEAFFEGDVSKIHGLGRDVAAFFGTINELLVRYSRSH